MRRREGIEQIGAQVRTSRGLSEEVLTCGAVQSMIAPTQHMLAMPPALLLRCVKLSVGQQAVAASAIRIHCTKCFKLAIEYLPNIARPQ